MRYAICSVSGIVMKIERFHLQTSLLSATTSTFFALSLCFLCVTSSYRANPYEEGTESQTTIR